MKIGMYTERTYSSFALVLYHRHCEDAPWTQTKQSQTQVGLPRRHPAVGGTPPRNDGIALSSRRQVQSQQ